MKNVDAISVFGTGYVGCTLIGCVANKGLKVIGVDIDEKKLALLNKGDSPIREKEIIDQIKSSEANIFATKDGDFAVTNSVISFICVGTPSTEDGSANIEGIINASQSIGISLKNKNSYHLVVIRSTVPPNTCKKSIQEIEKYSGKKCGIGFGFCMNPEFMREGSSVSDFLNPSYTIIGTMNENDAKILKLFYGQIGIKENIYVVDLGSAELFKYFNNYFHALKVAFANEVGRICKNFNADSQKLMEIFCKDKKLNISQYYLRPGFAFGGSCLPKDLRAIKKIAEDADIKVPIAGAVIESNKAHIESARNKIKSLNPSRVLFLGITFKSESSTDDLRESAYLILMKNLIDDGISVSFFDENINLAELIGANRKYVLSVIPEFELCQILSLDKINFDLIVIGSCKNDLIINKFLGKTKIIDLRGIKSNYGGYDTIV